MVGYGYGGTIYADLRMSGQLIMNEKYEDVSKSGHTFTNCSNVNGYGGAIAVYLNDGVGVENLRFTGTVILFFVCDVNVFLLIMICLGSLSFDNCTAESGDFISLNGRDLSTITTNNPFSYPYSLVNENHLRGYERDDGIGEVDLRDFLCLLRQPTTLTEFGCDIGCFQLVVCNIT
jgi:hypothetical protein